MKTLFCIPILCLAFAASGKDSIPEAEGADGFIIEKPGAETADSVEQALPDAGTTEREEKLVLKSGEELERTVSVANAFYSLLMPGLGEYRIGRPKLGKSLMVADGLFWLGLGAALYYRSGIFHDLRAYLYSNAACDGNGSFSGRNAWDLTEAELELPLYADSSAFYEQRVYMPSRDELMQKIDFYWQWDSEKAHQEYYDMWGRANRAKVFGYYLIGAAVVTRVVSFINTGRLIRKMGMENIDQSARIELIPRYYQEQPGLSITCRF